MGGFLFGGAATQPVNPDIPEEDLGFGATGVMTLITAGGTNHTKGAYSALGTTTVNWCGFWLEIGDSSATNVRFLLDIAFGATGSESIVFPDLYLEAAFANGRIFIPLQVPTTTQVSIRCQSSTLSSTFKCAIIGVPASAALPPGFATVTALTAADNAGTRASTTTVTPATTVSYSQMIASTAANYGAIMVTPSLGATAFAVAQQGTLITATGGAGSESIIARQSCRMATTGTLVGRANRLIQKAIPSGTRIACAILAPAADNAARVQVHGFS